MTLPLLTAAGYDPVWFGVFLVLMVEIGLLTPPVGINLFVLQGLTNWPLGRVARASVPFFLLFGLGGLVETNQAGYVKILQVPISGTIGCAHWLGDDC